MLLDYAHLRASDVRDEGFSLVEVMVAIAIVSVVALATASLTISGIASAATQQRRQVAVTVASGAMEAVSALPAGDVFTGRAQADVLQAFADNSGVAGVAQTYPGWDPSPAIGSTLGQPAVVQQNGTDYRVTTLVGTCYQPKVSASAVPGGDCTKVAGFTPPSLLPSGYTTQVRVVVVVTWTAGATCTASGCSYVASTLIDPNADLEWVTSG